MKPKKQVAVKLKTLTITLALATGINITNAFADETADAIKAKAFGDSLIDLLKYATDYKKAEHPTSVTGSGANEDPYVQKEREDGTGTYNATGRGEVKKNNTTIISGGEAAKITGGIDLKGTRLAELGASAPNLSKTNETAFLKVFDGSITGTKVQALSSFFNELYNDLNLDANENPTFIKIVNKINNNESNNTDEVDDIDTNKNYSTVAEKDVDVNNIDTLNFVIDAITKELAKDKLGKLDSTERIKTFFDYAVAYVGNKTAADADKDGKDFTTTGGGNAAVAGSGYSALYNAVSGALANKDNQAAFIKDKGLHAITTDEDLEKAASTSATDLTNATALTQNSAKVQNAINAHFKAAKNATGNEQTKLYEKAAASLTPNTNCLGRAAAAPIVRAVNDLVDARMQIINNSGMSTGDEYENGNAWLRVAYVNYDAKAKDAANLGYRQRSASLGLGCDQQLDEKINLGLSYNYVKSNLDGKDGYQLKDDIKSNAFGIYITMMHRSMFADAQFNYIKNKIDGKRIIGADDETSDVNYKYKSNVKNVVLGFGMNFNFNDNGYVKPKACIALSHYRSDQFNEAGGLDAALDVNQGNYTSVELGMQLVAGVEVMRDNFKLQPKIKFGFMYDLNDKGNKLTYNFMGSDISTEGAKHDRANLNLGASFGLVMDKLTLDFGYDFRWSSNSTAHGLVVKLGRMF